MTKENFLVYSLATNYPESNDSTFPIKFVHAINKEFAKMGIKVKTITPHSKGAQTSYTMDDVKIRRFRYLPEGMQFNYSSIPDEIRQSKLGYIKMIIMTLAFFNFTFFECLREKPDIIHSHWSFPTGVIAHIMSKIFKVKFIVTIHGGEFPFLKKFKFIRNSVVRALNDSEIVCANSNYSRDELIKMGVKENKVIKLNVPPNFVTHSSDSEFLREFRKKFAKPSTKIILFCGRIVERKGVEYLIRAIKELEKLDIHLMVVGGGDLLEKLKELTKSIKLEEKVTFFGRASNKELGYLHDISDVFVCPSIIDSKGNTEYLGLVIPEAMESGLPVIASSVGGIVDIIKNEENGLLVPQKDPAAIAKAVELIFSNHELRKRILENSKKTVKEFSPKTIAEQYISIFKKITSE